MRHGIIITALCILLAACSGNDGKQEDNSTDTYEVEVMLPTTPVKDQGNSQMCWIYAMLATIETEHIRQGDSIDLSAAYLARHALAQQATYRYSKGKNHNVATRGMLTATLSLLQQYGAMPYTSYRPTDGTDYRNLARQMMRTADSSKAHKTGLEKLQQKTANILNEAMGYAPDWVFMLGCRYTPVEFAHSILQRGEYAALTSFTHHPWGSIFELEVPDNFLHDTFINVPVDSLAKYAENAIRQGHPVAWEGDITEKGFNHKLGKAMLDNESQPVTQQSRQHDFDSETLTDDHCMEIVGLAHDKKGNKFFVCKNSWGKDNPYGGFVYMSEKYLKAKTIAVVIPTAALPTMAQIKGKRTQQPTDPDIIP